MSAACRFLAATAGLKMDRNENQITITKEGINAISRKTRTRANTVSEIIAWCVKKTWLVVTEELPDGSLTIYEARNYGKYHRKRDAKESQASSSPKLSETKLPLLKKEKEEQEEEKENFSTSSTLYHPAEQLYEAQRPYDDRTPEIRNMVDKLTKKKSF